MNLWKNNSIRPMLLSEVDKPFNSSDYLYELKFDGIRALIFVSQKYYKIISRNGIDLTSKFPELALIKNNIKENIILDGEIVYFDKNKPSFSKIQIRNRLTNKDRIKEEAIDNPVTFVAFDILYKNKSLIDLKLEERKKILANIKENEVFLLSKIYDDGIKLFKSVKKLGLEGIVAKNKNSVYEINKRTSSWIKIKNTCEKEFFIGGYIIKKNNYISLLLGEMKNNKLFFVGASSIKNNKKLYNQVIKSKIISDSPFCDYQRKANFIKPKLKCLVKYLEKTKNNHLRQPIIKE